MSDSKGRIWVYDIEVFQNFFCVVFEDYHEEEREYFIIHHMVDDYQDLIKFMRREVKNQSWFVGFNNLDYDAQIIEYILDSHKHFTALAPHQVCSKLFIKSSQIINGRNDENFRLPYSEYKMKTRQLDIFKLNHWDNLAKRASLKWTQFTTDWHNLKESDIDFLDTIDTKEQIQEVLSYCVNDVASTKSLAQKSKKLIQLRMQLSNTYKIPLYSASEPRISKELFAYFLGKKLNKPKQEIKRLKPIKKEMIKVKDIILPYVKFTSPIFKSVLKVFEDLIIMVDQTKGGFKHRINHMGCTTDYGLGGIHGARSAGVYESNDEMIIMSSDVTSFYPNLAIRNKWSPEHIPTEQFCEQYEWFFDERKKIPKSDPTNYVYKIILNSTYGLSNDKNSYLYDPELTMKITMNGQLSLSMLYEMIIERIPDCIPLMQNTDGLETLIPRKYVDTYYEICKEWEDLTNLQLEHDTYQKLVLADVNNYIAVYDYKYTDKETWDKLKKDNPFWLFKITPEGFGYAPAKCKGRFEFNDLALHKNKSYLVIKKAVFNYFVHGILPEKYIYTNHNIFDFCGGVRINRKQDLYCHYLDLSTGTTKKTKEQKVTRFYISNTGGKLFKHSKENPGKMEQVQAGPYYTTVFNLFEEKSIADYNINYQFYLSKIDAEIKKIEGTNQYTLFL